MSGSNVVLVSEQSLTETVANRENRTTQKEPYFNGSMGNHWILTRVTRGVPLVEQKLVTLPELMSSSTVA